MLPKRRFEPERHKDLKTFFQEAINLTKGKREDISRYIRIYARRGRRGIENEIEEGRATPIEYAQCIFNLLELYPKELEASSYLREIRTKVKQLLSQESGETAPTEKPNKVHLKLVRDVE